MHLKRIVITVFLTALVSGAVARDGADGIADLRIARAKGDIVAAWLIMPTTRYEHFVLGSQYEAGGVRLRLQDGTTADLILPGNAVFEDREPRIADLDGDGRNEVVLVKSRLDVGSSLAVIGLRKGKAVIVAETPPNGQARRWLNPAGISDFLSNGKLQVALVRMPHLAGRLEFWSYDNGKLSRAGTFEKVSNHQIGSKNQRLSGVLRGKEGGDLLIIPAFDFLSLLIIAATPQPHKVASYPLEAKVAGNLSVKGNTISVPLQGGGVQRLTIE